MTIPSDPAEQNPTSGVFWMIVAGLNFVAVIAIVKHVGRDVPAAQSAFLRYALGLVLVIPMIRPMLRAGVSRSDRNLFCLRGGAHALGVVCWFYAMTQISIAEVTAMNYMSPVYVTLGAAVFLGETLAIRRLTAAAAALIGALIVLRPGFRELSLGHFAMIFTAIFFAASYLIAKRMADRFSATVVVGWLSLAVTVGLAPLAFMVWEPVSIGNLLWLFAVAVFATAGHYTMTLAFRAAPVSATQSAAFLQLIWSALLGAAFFSEPVDAWVMLGGAVIVGAVSFIAWREAQLRRRAAVPSHPPADS